MTLVVGVLCTDGVVVGSDSAITFGGKTYKTIEQKGTKVRIINDKVVLSGTGEVGLSQRFHHIVKKYWNDNKYVGKTNIIIAKELCISGMRDMQSTGFASGHFPYGAVLAFSLEGHPYLCEFPPDTFQPEFKFDSLWYVSMGSGQLIADPFLGFVRKVFWDDKQPNVDDGLLGTLWALQHTIDVNAGGVNEPVQIAVLKKENGDFVARKFDDLELEGHKEFIKNFENYIKEYKNQFKKEDITKVLPVFEKNKK